MAEGQGTCSHQLVSPGSLTFSADASSIPTSFADGIAVNRSAPDSFDALGLTGFSLTGADADKFDLDPADLPASIDGNVFALDLQFSGTEIGSYAATLNLQTDTPGLVIPFEILGTITGDTNGPGPSDPTDPTDPNAIPSPTAAGAGLFLLAGLSLRRRRHA